MASMLDDLSLLTSLHRQVILESGRGDLLEITDALEARCRSEDPDAPGELVNSLDPQTAELIARLLTVHLHLTNLAEERHRARSVRREDGALPRRQAGLVRRSVGQFGDSCDHGLIPSSGGSTSGQPRAHARAGVRPLRQSS